MTMESKYQLAIKQVEIRDVDKPVVEATQPEKQLSVVESDPFQKVGMKRYMMLTAQERLDIKAANPELNVRLTEPGEQAEYLCIRDDVMDDTPVTMTDLTEMTEIDEDRRKLYEEAMTWLKEIMRTAWILNNPELVLMPDLKIIRWKW